MLLMDIASVVLAFGLSLLIRYESWNAMLYLLGANWLILVLGVAISLTMNYKYGLYARLWRFASVTDLLHIIASATSASIVVALINYLVFPFLNLSYIDSYSVWVLDWGLNLGFLSLSRLTLRIGLNWLTSHNKQLLGKLVPIKRVLIMGAGDIGSTVIRWIKNNPEMGLIPVGFIDDDPTKIGAKIYGVPVLGDRKSIPTLIAKNKVKEVIIAMPTASQASIDDVCRNCEKASVPTRVIPSIHDLLGGTITIEQLRQWRPLEFRVNQPRPIEREVPEYRNIMVTGGAGFMGSNFVRYMLEKYPNYRIVTYDKVTYAGNLDNLLGLKERYDERHVFVKGDICEYGPVSEAIQRYNIDAIVNFAAETHVDRSLMNPDHFLHTNVYGTYTLLEAAKQFKILRYHQISTDEVYGQVARGSFGEEDPLETRSPYSASKAAADLLVHAYHVSYGVPVTITRGSNNIGPYQYPEKVVPLFVTNALEDQPLPVYGDGKYVRDYLYVQDHGRGVDLVLHKGVSGEIYNLGAGNETEAIDLAKAILDRLGKPYSLIRFVEDRAGQDRRYSLNNAKTKSLGWTVEYDFESALDATIAWYLENQWWWRKIKSGEYWEYYEQQYRKRLEEAIHYVLSE